MSDTPRMDAAIDLCGDYEKPRQYAMRIERAGKKLERELNIALSQVEQLQAENARLREALQQMVKYARAEGKGLRIADEALASTNSTWLAEHDDEVRRKVLEEVYKEVNCGITHVRWALEIIHRMAKQPESK